MTITASRRQVLVAAAGTVKKKQERRRWAIVRMLHKQKPTLEVAVSLFYLSRGTVPRSLWE